MKYEKWSLGYWCLKQYVIFADWLIYRKTIIIGKENIPNNKPIVFAPNHQNALSDPLSILLNTKFQPVWLARADIFKSKVVGKILRFLKIMPVYRMRDGKENLVKNDKTFADSIKVLEHNFALALFPEAAHSGKRQMLVHKKAVPRIVFMAEEKTNFKLDIQVIPAGIYYSNYWKFNRTLIVNFGEPIPAKDYRKEYIENQNAAILSFKDKIQEAILPLVLDIKSKKFYNEFELIREIYGKHFLKRQHKKLSPVNHFKSDQILANKLDQLEKANLSETEKLIADVKSYAKKIKENKLRSWLLEENNNNLLHIALNKLVLILGFPLFLFGFLFNAIPFFLIDKLVRKKVKDNTFWSTFFLIAGLVIFPLFYLIEFLSIGWLVPFIWLKIVLLLSIPFAGKLAFKWYILGRKTIGRIRLFLLKSFKNEHYKKITTEKHNLFHKLDTLITV